MRQQARQHFLHLRTKHRPVAGFSRERLLRVLPHQFVEVFVAAGNGKRGKLCRKGHRVGICAKFDIAAEERPELLRRLVSHMSHLQLRRRQPRIRHLPADANQRHQPKLDLVPIGLSVDVDVIERNRRGPILQAEAQPDALIQDPAVTFGALKRIIKLLRRRHHVVQQANLAEIEAARQMKAEQVVLQFDRSKFQQPDLGAHLEPDGSIAELFGGHPRLRKDGRRVLAQLAQPRARQPCDPAGGLRDRAKALFLREMHDERPSRDSRRNQGMTDMP